MHSSVFPDVPEPNADLAVRTYVQPSGKFLKHFDFIDVNNDGLFALGTSDLTGKIWCGAVWMFSDISAVPEPRKCLGNIDVEHGVSTGKWFGHGRLLAFGTDSGAVCVVSTPAVIENKKRNASLKYTLRDHEDGITSLDICVDDLRIVTGSLDMSIKVFDVEGTRIEKSYCYAHSRGVNCVRFKPAETDIFISASGDGDALLWDIRCEKPASLFASTESGFTACCWTEDNCIVLGDNEGTLHLMDTRMNTELDFTIASKRPIHFINLERGSRQMAVCSDTNVIKVYDCTEKKLIKTYESDKHQDFVRGLCWKSKNLYSCGFDKEVFEHDVSVPQECVTKSMLSKADRALVFEAKIASRNAHRQSAGEVPPIPLTNG